MALSIMKICLAFEENTQDIQLVDSELFEGRAIVKEIDYATTDVDKLSKEAETSEKIVEILGGNDNVSVEAVQLAEINLSSLRRKLNYQSSNVSVESVRNLQVALEEEKGFLARIWDMIKAVFKWIGEKISQFVNWIKGLFGGGKPKKAEEAIQKAADAKISLDVNPPVAGTPHDPTRDVAKTTMVVSSSEMDKLLGDVMKVVDEKFTTEKTNTISVPMAGENVTITKANAKSSLEKAIEKTSTFDTTEESLICFNILAEHKEEYINYIKKLDVKKLSLFKEDFMVYLKAVETMFKTLDMDKVVEDIENKGMKGNDLREYTGAVLSVVLMPEHIARCFKNSTVESSYYSCTLQLNEEKLSFQLGLTKINKVSLNQSGPIHGFVKPFEKKYAGTFKVKDSDIKFLAKEVDAINNKVAKDIKDLDSGLDIIDFIKKVEAEEGALELRKNKMLDKLTTGPNHTYISFTQFATELKRYVNAIKNFISELSGWWRHTLSDITLDYNAVVEFVMRAAQTLHKAERRNEDTIEWLTKLCNSKT